jgi:hypothetical protein
MSKSKDLGMQHHTRDAEVSDLLHLPSSVRRIAKEWMAEGSQMNPQLMGPSGQRPEKDMRSQLSEAFQHLIVRR